MGLLDGVLGQIMGGGENAIVANLAAKVGLTPEQAESAIAALTQAHPQPGDTVQTASDTTGLPQEILQQVLGHLGGEGGLTAIASSLLGKSE
ncbi:hypothetical protein [Flavisphingomonas formosensis]|uniref:hypothetical protein n=1 Tax=Flavisphingomonas formosensis TaxID=861534 RepID=UPI0012F8E6E2|nr:hypothetical protein [Sphingomonas formosensis]